MAELRKIKKPPMLTTRKAPSSTGATMAMTPAKVPIPLPPLKRRYKDQSCPPVAASPTSPTTHRSKSRTHRAMATGRTPLINRSKVPTGMTTHFPPCVHKLEAPTLPLPYCRPSVDRRLVSRGIVY